jgi:superfamily II DNA/RNA helicase
MHFSALRQSVAVCAQIIAFFVTARVTQFYCELFQAMGIPVLEMHSRKSQAQRTKAADQFRASKGACIMFSSDVSARGVDYPDVSLVAQVGAHTWVVLLHLHSLETRISVHF